MSMTMRLLTPTNDNTAGLKFAYDTLKMQLLLSQSFLCV